MMKQLRDNEVLVKAQIHYVFLKCAVIFSMHYETSVALFSLASLNFFVWLPIMSQTMCQNIVYSLRLKWESISQRISVSRFSTQSGYCFRGKYSANCVPLRVEKKVELI